MGRYIKLGKNVILLAIGNFSSKVLTFLLVPLYTSVLSTAEYGISDLIVTAINLISPIFTLHISEAVTRFALDKGDNKNHIFSIGLYTVLLGFAIMMLFSPLYLLFNELRSYYWIFVLLYLVITLHSIVSQFVRGIEKISLYSASGVINSSIVILFNILFLLYFRLGLVGYLWSLILGHLITIIFLFISVRLNRYIVPINKINKVLIKAMVKYSVPMIPNSISWWISNSSDKYMLTAFCGVAVTGIYSVAYKIPTFLTTFTTIFMSAWQISAVEGFGTEKTRVFFSEVYNRYSSIIIIITSFLIMSTKLIARILFAKDFYQAWTITPILLFAFLFGTMSTFLGSIYTSAKKSKMLFYSAIVGAALNIFINLILIPIFKGTGAAIATLISYFIVWLIRLIHTKKIMVIDIDYKCSIICFLLIAFQIIVVNMESSYSLILSVFIFIFIIIIQYKTMYVMLYQILCWLKRIRTNS